MLKKFGLIFKSPMSTVSCMRHLGSFIMYGQQRVHAIVLHAVPFIIRVNPHLRNTSKHC